MHDDHTDELHRLRAKVQSLRDQVFEAELQVRLADREREYQRRTGFLVNAATQLATGREEIDGPLAELLTRVKTVVAEVHTQGYAVVPEFLDRPEVERLRDALGPLYATIRRMFGKLEPETPRQTFHIHNVLAKTRAVDEVAINPLLRAIVGGVLGPDFLLHAGAVAMSPDPGCSPQGLHRDDASYSELPRPRMPLVLTAAIALDDYTQENGATHLVPGSHCWSGSRRPEPSEVIQCEMSAGSLLLWDGALFHAGGGNSTRNDSRRTLTFNYTRGWLRTQFNQFVSVPRDLVLKLPPELQKDLGYHPSARGLGECDNQHPLAYLRRLIASGGEGAQPTLGPELADAAVEAGEQAGE